MTNTEQILASKKKWRQIERKQTSRALRQVHNALIEKTPSPSSDFNMLPNAVWVIGGILACGIILFSCAAPAHAYTEAEAIRVIVGEASNQGLVGMTCVAEVIRSRSSLKGFYGLKASHSSKEPKWVWDMARKAWLASKTSNITNHATHFENIAAFGCPYWSRNCVVTLRLKDHVFMKEII